MKKKIIIFFIVLCTIFVFIGSLFFFKVDIGKFCIEAPLVALDVFTCAPNGANYNMNEIGEELAADVATIFVVGQFDTYSRMMADDNRQLKRHECKSTLDKAIYLVQATLRKMNGTYPNPIYDTSVQYSNNFVIAFKPYDNGRLGSVLNVYNLRQNFLNVSYVGFSDGWKPTYGYHITKDSDGFIVEVFDTTPDHTLHNHRQQPLKIPYEYFSSSSRGLASELSYKLCAWGPLGDTYAELTDVNLTAAIPYGMLDGVHNSYNDTLVSFVPYRDYTNFYIAF